MTWIVVNFLRDDSVEVVPKDWVIENNKWCYWPPQGENVQKAIHQCKPAGFNWNKFEVKVLTQKVYSDFKKASSKASRACETSDFTESTESEEINGTIETRKLKKVKQYDFIYESDSYECEDCDNGIPKFPDPDDYIIGKC